jgi:hypothetical protein
MRARVVGVGGLAILALACGGGGGRGGGRHAGARGGNGPSPPPVIIEAPPSAPATQADADADAARKIDGYVGLCLNRFSPRIRESRDRYLSWADERSGPTGHESVIYGLYTVGFEPSDCIETTQKYAGSSPPFPEVEAAGKAYAEVLGDIVARLVEADRYYTDEDYKDDGMKKGREMHRPLLDAWRRFDDADEKLSAAVEVQEDLLDVRLTDTGKPRSQHVARRMLMTAKTMARDADLSTVRDGRIADLDLARFEADIATYETALTALHAYVDAKVYGDEDDIDGLADLGDDLDGAAKKMRRRLKDGEAYDAMERGWVDTSAGWMVDGSADDVLAKYEKIVDEFNWEGTPKFQVPAHRSRGL